MKITFKQIKIKDKNIVLSLFKKTAEKIKKKNIDHWQYWINPPQEKVKWVEAGINNNEFFFLDDLNGKNIGMVRILNEDLLYWGKQTEKSKYVHSLVIKEEYNGKGIGIKVLQEIENMAKKENYKYVRLDADSKNLNLCKYYENLNFIKVGIKKSAVSNNNLYEKEIL